jgi:4-hydroxybutyrate dehydrogenase
MLALKVKPEIYYFDTVKEFNEEFKIGENDFILTNEWIYKPYIEPLGVAPKVIFQEKYGTGEPSDEMIDGIAAEMKTLGQIDRIIALGGGSTIDICKVLALKLPEKSLDLFMEKVKPEKDKELVIIPTTCGTGSEVTNVAVAGLSNGLKKGIASPDTFGDKAILIPETMQGLPYKVFTTSSVDALIHAVESYLSPKATPFTEMYSLEAIKLIVGGYKAISGKDQNEFKKYLKDFTLASNYAGIAFGVAGCAAVHALAYSIGGAFHVPHGEANYQFFTTVLNFYNKKNPNGKIKSFTDIVADVLGIPSDENTFVEFDKFLGALIEKKPFREYGMVESQIEEFAKSTVDNQKRLWQNSYVIPTYDDYVEVFKTLY